MSNPAYAQAVTKALISSLSHSYGSLVKPDVRAVPAASVRGTVPAPLTQWVLQGDKFESLLIEQYQTIRPGDTKLLIAATGVGKTTRLPLQLALSSGKAGLVLLPDVLPIVITLRYINEVVIPSFKQDVIVLPLRSEHVREPKRGAVVYYSTAADFLPRFHADPKLVKRMNFDFIYMDEAHENHPAYHVMRILVGMGFFSDTKVFMGTATSTGTSLMLTGTKNQVTPIACPSSMFPLQNPEQTPMQSPLHFSRITCRTLIFLPNDNTIDLWHKYYDGCDIRVITYHSYDTSTKIPQIENMLKTAGPIALLSTKRLETGCTLAIDTVICSGYYEEMVVDYTVPAVSLEVVRVTQVKRTQRMGRVGRHLVGCAYYNDVAVSPPEPELTMTSAIYVWMWMRMFNIVMKNPEIAQFDELLGDFSNEAVSLLLCSRLHPVLVIPYLTDEGALYKGWHIMKTVFCTDREIVESEDDNVDRVEEWSTMNTGPQMWLDQPEQYKTKTIFPDEWQALPLAAWKSFSGAKLTGMSMDNRSVVSALVSGKPKHQKSVKISKSASVKSHAATVVSRPKSIMTVKNSESPVAGSFVFPAIREEEDEQSVSEIVHRVPMKLLPVVAHSRQPSSDRTEEVVREDSIKNWVETTSRSGRRRRSHHSSSSASSHDRFLLNLKKVNAVDYKYYKLYPMDTLLLSVFMSAESAHSSDFKNFNNLIKIRENFSSLSRDHERKIELQNEYFLSVLRVHNHQVMEKLQVKASGADKPTFMSKLMGRDFSSVDDLITSSTRLIQSMQFEGYFVGIDKRTLHSNDSDDRVAVERINLDKARAEFLLGVADERLALAVGSMQSVVQVLSTSQKIAGTAWHFGHAIVMPLHVYDKEGIDLPYVTTHVNQEKDIVVCRSDVKSREHPQMRGPVEGEQVLFVGVDPVDGRFCSIGPGKVLHVGDVWLVDKSLDFGYSGFAVLSVEDFCIVGLYRGMYMSLGANQFSHFISVSDFLSEVARIY